MNKLTCEIGELVEFECERNREEEQLVGDGNEKRNSKVVIV